MKLNQFGGGGLFELHSNGGGVCCFENRIAKMGGVSTYFIKYGLIIEYICYYFAFWGRLIKFSFKKFFSCEVDLGGVYTKYVYFGGGPHGIGRKWGGSASGARRAQNWYTPPLLMFLIPSLSIAYIPNLGPLGPLLHVEKLVAVGGLCVKQF